MSNALVLWMRHHANMSNVSKIDHVSASCLIPALEYWMEVLPIIKKKKKNQYIALLIYLGIGNISMGYILSGVGFSTSLFISIEI